MLPVLLVIDHNGGAGFEGGCMVGFGFSWSSIAQPILFGFIHGLVLRWVFKKKKSGGSPWKSAPGGVPEAFVSLL